MADRLRIQPHPHGPWIVSAGKHTFAVPADLGRMLLPLQGEETQDPRWVTHLDSLRDRLDPGDVAALTRALSSGGRRGKDGAGLPVRRCPRRRLLVRFPLVAAATVESLAKKLRRLASWPAMLLAGGGIILIAGTRPWLPAPQLSAASLSLFVAGALWHEMGHAAALSREGYRPGGIGAGLLFCMPVLFADVSTVAVLPRAGRLRVDVAGMAFQTGAAGVFALLGILPGLPPPISDASRAASLFSMAAVGWSALPFVRADGYWILADLLGVGDLTRPAPPEASARLRRTLVVIRALQTAFLGFVCIFLPARLVSLASDALGRLGMSVEAPHRTLASQLLVGGALAWWTVGALRQFLSRKKPAHTDS